MLEGIEIKDASDPAIHNNEVHENLECGIFAHSGALGRIENNKIFKNAHANIEVVDGSNPLVKGNQIYMSQSSGISVHASGQGRFEDNDVYANDMHGIMVQ